MGDDNSGMDFQGKLEQKEQPSEPRAETNSANFKTTERKTQKPLWKQDQDKPRMDDDWEVEVDEGKQKTLKILLAGICFNRSYALVLSIMLPLYCAESHRTLSEVEIGFLNSGVQLVQILVGPFMPGVINRQGHKRIMMFSYLLCISSMACFSLLEFLNNDPWYFGLAFIFRIIFGIGTGFLNISVMSIISVYFSINKAKYISHYLIAEGVGAMFGPVFMLLTEWWAPFNLMVFMICCLQLIPAYITYAKLPEELNTLSATVEKKEDESDDEIDPDDSKATAQKYNFVNLFLNLRGISVCLINSLTIILSMYNSTTFVLRFDELGMSVYYTYFVIFLCVFGYAPAAYFITKYTRHSMARAILMISLIGNVFACLLVGPSDILKIPESVGIITIGLVFQTAFNAMGNVVVIPETYKCAEMYARNMQGGRVLNDLQVIAITDYASATVNIWKATGFALSTVVGGALYDAGGYVYSCDFMAFFTLAVAVCYIPAMYFISRQEDKYTELFKKYEFQADQEYMAKIIQEAKMGERISYNPELIPLLEQNFGVNLADDEIGIDKDEEPKKKIYFPNRRTL